MSYNFRSKELQVRDNDSSIVCIILQANLILPFNYYYYYQTITNSNSQILQQQTKRKEREERNSK